MSSGTATPTHISISSGSPTLLYPSPTPPPGLPLLHNPSFRVRALEVAEHCKRIAGDDTGLDLLATLFRDDLDIPSQEAPFLPERDELHFDQLVRYDAISIRHFSRIHPHFALFWDIHRACDIRTALEDLQGQYTASGGYSPYVRTLPTHCHNDIFDEYDALLDILSSRAFLDTRRFIAGDFRVTWPDIRDIWPTPTDISTPASAWLDPVIRIPIGSLPVSLASIGPLTARSS